MTKVDFIEKPFNLFEDVNQGVMFFRVSQDHESAVLIYANNSILEVLDHPNSNTEILGVLTLKQLLKIDGEQVKKFVSDKLNGIHLTEQRIISISKFKAEKVTIAYRAYHENDSIILQLTVDIKSESDLAEYLQGIEESLARVQLSSGRMAIMVIKNYKTIIDIYGETVYTELKNNLFKRIYEVVGSVQLLDFGHAMAIVSKKEISHLEDHLKKLTLYSHEFSYKNDNNIFCDLRIGVSSLCDNVYRAYHEAKFCIDKIVGGSYELMVYSEPDSKQFSDFLIRSDLQFAIENNELNFLFQGIYNISNMELYGFEVLVRWHHHKYGVISPNDFIPIAEEIDLIAEIDLWVVEHALERYDGLILDGKENLKLNFNISPRDFYVDSFVERFLGLIENANIKFENVILELTETLNLAPKRDLLERIKNRGVMIALDDFGTGFASLSQLKNYHIDFLKIDISFIRDINKNYDNTLITKAILNMAEGLNIHVIAEGVEEEEQLRFLRDGHCMFAQGFKFHKPTPYNALKKSLDEGVKIKTNNKYNEPFESKKLKAQEFIHGNVKYIPLSIEGRVLSEHDDLSCLLNLDSVKDKNFSEFITSDLRPQFKKHLREVVEDKSQVYFITKCHKLNDSVTITLFMKYSVIDELVDVLVESYESIENNYLNAKDLYNRYDLIFQEAANAIVVTTLDYIITEWNKGATRIFGYEREEAINKNVIKLLVQEKDYEKVVISANRTLQEESNLNINENMTKNGGFITCEWHNKKIMDTQGEVIGLVSHVRDISKEVTMMEELNVLSTVLKQEPAGVVLTDINGDIEFVNESFCTITGYSKEELIGENPKVLQSGKHDQKFYEDMWNTLLLSGAWVGHFYNKKKSGEEYITDSRIFPIKNSNGVIKKYACIQKDITSQVEKDNYVVELSRSMENQERLSMVGQMAAGIMHEINNPLSFMDINIHALKDMLGELDINDDNQELIEELLDLSADLKDGINSIKEIAAGLKRFTYHSQSSSLERIDINEEISNVVIISKNEYKYYANLEFIRGDIEEVYCDSGKFKQVILNLIINAAHAIREQESDNLGDIVVKTFEEGDYVCCDITDTGTGIPEAVRGKIFESFFTTKEKGKGTGLGLSLSKKIIEEELKGSLTFDTVMGEGTTFKIRLNKATE